VTDPSTPDTPASRIDAEISQTPLPTRRELRRRSSLPRQAVRFVVLNVKIFRLSRQHH
jgi:hypothetical protein